MKREHWVTAKLRDLVYFQEGPGLRKWQWAESGIKVINGTNIQLDGTFDPSNTDKYVAWEEFRDKYLHFEVQANDIVVSSSGTLAKVARVKSRHLPMMMNTSVIRFRGLEEKGLLDAYLFHWLRSEKFKNQALAMATGSAQQNFGPSHINIMEIELPPEPIQRRVASILSAYDDLIENNTRRIAVLEEMARRVYEEWFVRFRNPKIGATALTETEIGHIPQNWEVREVQDTFGILGGGTPSKARAEYWNGGTVNWYSPTDLTKSGRAFVDRSAFQITDLGLAKSSARLFPAFSVMLTSRATIGVVAINTTPACTNQGFITCLPSDDFPISVLYHWLKHNVPQFISLGTGATFKEITKGVFKKIKLVVPPPEVTRQFHEAVWPIMQMIHVLEKSCENLRSQRDLLLPKLLSGQMELTCSVEDVA